MNTRYGKVTEEMLSYCLLPSEEARLRVLAQALDFTRFYVVAHPGTKARDWQKRNFAAYVDESKTLVLFLTMDEACRFARRGHIVVDSQPMVMKAAKSVLAEMVMEYYEGGLISRIAIFSAPPLYVGCSIQEFLGTAKNARPTASPSTIMQQAPIKETCFLEVEKIRSVLDTMSNAERRKLDPAGRFENSHQLIETLLMRNQIDPASVDEMFQFAPGFTRNFCESIVDSSISKNALKSLLAYFGLGEYIYIYKKDCKELQEELKNNPGVDQYALRAARISTKEPFELVAVQRGKDENNGAYVYGLTLQGKYRRQRIVVSSVLGCEIGKKYEIEGLPPLLEQNNPEGVTKAHRIRAVNDEEPEPKADDHDAVIRPSKPGRQLKGTPEEQKARQDYIIGHFKKTDGINLSAAVEKYKVLAEDPDVLEAYYKYLKERKYGWLVRNGVTPEMLVKEYHYPPYEAFCIMVRMQDDPSGTTTMLKHRKSEPQYQKPVTKG